MFIVYCMFYIIHVKKKKGDAHTHTRRVSIKKVRFEFGFQNDKKKGKTVSVDRELT